MKQFIVELEKGVFLANWEGDQGRTLKFDSAKKFKNRKATKNGISESECDLYSLITSLSNSNGHNSNFFGC